MNKMTHTDRDGNDNAGHLDIRIIQVCKSTATVIGATLMIITKYLAF